MQRLIACGVQDIPFNAEEANNFGFTAEDIGDYIFDVLLELEETYLFATHYYLKYLRGLDYDLHFHFVFSGFVFLVVRSIIHSYDQQ